ncbi:SDR family NAD(P)-dependent oxidoreductase [Paenibacillus ihuae]|uniref:SDR family NAD(P)-dependent oxidoreductase n=1 Tax=Paenibacillus ihuae TaxID=1232431 RepID=UPI0006D5606C|nr:SDR family oxidoreductase [Paenibacillus ihuae]
MLETMKIIVTGAASGIGKAIVHRSLAEGAAIIACDINGAALDKLQQEEDSLSLFTYCLDTGNYAEVEQFFAYIAQEHSDVNGLVNNAGIYLGKNILDYKPDEIDKVLNVNVKGYLYSTQLFGKLLLEQERRGTIVNMSSVSGQEGSSDAVYGLSKAAVLGLTKSCAMNFAPYIRVNAVAPTMTNTPMMSHIPAWRQQEYTEHQLIREPLLAEDIADSVIFLLSKKSRAYTGATFDINSGCYLR